MGNGRFLYDNFITSATMVEVTSLIAGIVTAPYKEGAGSAGLTPYGNYTGAQDLEYVVEIMSTAGASGNEVGHAQFRWRDSDTAWDASSVVTSNSTLDLNNGVKIRFSSGAGNDFEMGDAWYFKGINLYNPGKMLDLDRNTRFRAATGASAADIKVDLGSSRAVTAFVLFDHNLSSNSTITLSAGNDTVCTAHSTKVSWNSEKIVHYPSTNPVYQYWKVSMVDSTSTNVEVGELFLGSYWEPSDNFQVDSDHPTEIISDKIYTPYGVRRDIYRNRRKNFSLVYPYMKTTDRDSFDTMLAALADQDAKKYSPVFFNSDSTTPNEVGLYKINAVGETWHKARFTVSLDLEEMVKSV